MLMLVNNTGRSKVKESSQPESRVLGRTPISNYSPLRCVRPSKNFVRPICPDFICTSIREAVSSGPCYKPRTSTDTACAASGYSESLASGNLQLVGSLSDITLLILTATMTVSIKSAALYLFSN